MIRIEVSPELADDMVAEGLAIRPGTRSSTAQLLIDGATAAATTISLLQAPDTFAKLAAMIKGRFAKQKDVTLKIKGKRGTVEVVVTADTDLENLAKLIKDGLVGDLE